jgi:signal transduction histidine kinase
MSIPLPSGAARPGALRLPRSGVPMFRILFLALYTLLAAEDWSAAFPIEGWGTGSDTSLIVLGLAALSAAAWNLSRLQTLTCRDPAAALKLASTVQGSLEQVIGELRQTMVALRPPILDERGLGEAIQAHVVRLNPSMGFSISADLPQRPEATIETVLFRVAQEALTNVAKHADARHVAVELRQADGQLVLEVADDGKGFNVERVERSHDAWRHFGLATMRERVQGLRGSLVVTSQPGLGTTVSARVPSCEPGAAVRR